ncbi:methanethiol oxidase-like, partial [Ornithodoros turicata]|uniref:methanethiol oxidase-like n=1 Tax=Ornithodoros turicata TaxID=34597 RepID=UPI00313A41A3
MSDCHHQCPSVGHPTPLAAMRGPHEKILYIPCIVPSKDLPDYLATICVDPESDDYGKVVHRLRMPNKGDELHHMNWNVCSSCYGTRGKSRDKLILPSLNSDRIYVVDVSADAFAPRLFKTLLTSAEGQAVSWIRTVMCLTDPEKCSAIRILISTTLSNHRWKTEFCAIYRAS